MVKNAPANAGVSHRFHPWIGKIAWGRKWQPTLVFLPGKSHGQRNLVGSIQSTGSPESDTTQGLDNHHQNVCKKFSILTNFECTVALIHWH